jgi:hypothetical protein
LTTYVEPFHALNTKLLPEIEIVHEFAAFSVPTTNVVAETGSVATIAVWLTVRAADAPNTAITIDDPVVGADNVSELVGFVTVVELVVVKKPVVAYIALNT